MLRKLMLLIMIASLLGCTTMQAVQSPTPQEIHDRLKVGDTVLVFVHGGRSFHVKITAIEPTALVGHDLDIDKNWRLPFDRIEQIRYEKISAAKTTGAIAGGLIVAYAIFVATAIYLFSRALRSASH